MTHYGLICPAASGHLNPMTTLGYELTADIIEQVVSTSKPLRSQT
ncbi:hypothetical protein [Crinalium epipsammum]|nr:hypothetical protein [Crinalium epipsammum]